MNAHACVSALVVLCFVTSCSLLWNRLQPKPNWNHFYFSLFYNSLGSIPLFSLESTGLFYLNVFFICDTKSMHDILFGLKIPKNNRAKVLAIKHFA